MTAISIYLIKVIICSGVLTGYYWLGLRNKTFNQWNRFYLLGTVICSMVLPLIHINFWPQRSVQGNEIIRLLSVAAAADEKIFDPQTVSASINMQQLLAMLYCFVSVCFLITIMVSNVRLLRIAKRSRHKKIGDTWLIETELRNSPFSFFNYIFWNRKIDILSGPGQHILKHELTHIIEKHSYDKVFINLAVSFYWINPFFWLIRKELSAIHEFIADERSVGNEDISVFADMILQASYPGTRFTLGNHFFYSPIKRRIAMQTKLKNPAVGYLSRVLALPVILLLVAAFTLRSNTSETLEHIHQNKDSKFVVVIDAGHGGTDIGAIGINGLQEKDINLSIARKVLSLNKNENIQIILTRSDDIYNTAKEKTELATSYKADAFISIHVNAADKETPGAESGFEVFVPSKRNDLGSRVLGTLLAQDLQPTYQTATTLMKRKGTIWVLDKNTCSAALVECGYITNEKDASFISDDKNQEKVALNFLSAIKKYAEASQQGFKNVTLSN